MPVRIIATEWRNQVVYTATLGYDPSRLVPLRVETEGTASLPAAISWDIESPGVLRITAAAAFKPAASGTLATVVFEATHGKKSVTTSMILPYVRAYAKCCPDPAPDTAGVVIIEGVCDRVMRRASGATLQQNIPNPVTSERGWTGIPFSLDAPGHIVIELYDAMGKNIRTLVNQDMGEGDHLIQLATRDLPSGVYTIMLRSEVSGVVTRTMIKQ
jgi:hypothetical protein